MFIELASNGLIEMLELAAFLAVGISLGSSGSRQAAQSFQEGASQSLSAQESTAVQRAQSEALQRSLSQAQSLGFSGVGPGANREALAGNVTNLAGQAIESAANVPNVNLPQLGAQGLFPQQRAAAQELVRQSFSGVSGQAAGRGQLSPQNLPGVAGSAVQRVLPQLLPLIGQNIRDVAGAGQQGALARAGAAGQVLPGLVGTLGSVQASQSRAASEAISQSISEAIARSVSQSRSEAFSKGEASSVGASKKFSFGFLS